MLCQFLLYRKVNHNIHSFQILFPYIHREVISSLCYTVGYIQVIDCIRVCVCVCIMCICQSQSLNLSLPAACSLGNHSLFSASLTLFLQYLKQLLTVPFKFHQQCCHRSILHSIKPAQHLLSSESFPQDTFTRLFYSTAFQNLTGQF